jgi:8-oxo-dGTP pyrophosphatase MutT (NUDIX family)
MIETVAAILIVGDGYALQLRDDLPGLVAYPGHWGLFGGTIHRDETPLAAVRREIEEELGFVATPWRELWTEPYRSAFDGHLAHSVIFDADVTALWPTRSLAEGQAAGVFRLHGLPRPIIPLAATLLERHGRLRS